jgi:integrase
MKKPPHTTVRYNTLWVRMAIPEEVRSCFDDKAQFMEQIGKWPANYDTANAAAAYWIASWKRQIRKARESPDWVSHMTIIDDRDADDVLEIMTEQELRDTARMFLASLKKQKTAIPEPAQVANTATPFLAHFETWKLKTHLKGKSRDQAASDVKAFGATVPETLEKLSGKHVQGWIESQTVSAVTVRRKLSALKSYWSWLKVNEHVATDRIPFDNRQVKDSRTKVEKALEQRQRFEPAEVVNLIDASADDAPLQALIRLAAHTGARREGLASLTKASVVMVDGVQSLRLHEKTAAGVRDVPVHPEIVALIAQLISDSRDGFLIPSEANKYGLRGDLLGKRFTRLKTALGFGERYVFHSLRHTVVHLMRRAECPLEIRNQILGHEDGDAGAGSGYGGHLDQKQKLEWLVKAVRY